MSAEQTRRVLQQNMPLPLDRIFESINLEKPLGSATISQVCLKRFLLRNAASLPFNGHGFRSDVSLSVTPDNQVKEWCVWHMIGLMKGLMKWCQMQRRT